MRVYNYMRRHFIQSSVFKSVGYDREAKILEVEFLDSGSVWQYHAFPPLAYKKFINAESRGHFFATMIRNKYHEVQVE
jgi:hypothetical protein